jgi:hypothetical protein
MEALEKINILKFQSFDFREIVYSHASEFPLTSSSREPYSPS